MPKKKDTRRNYICVDVGSYCIKAIEIQAEEGVYTLTNFAVRTIPASGSQENLSSELKATLAESNFISKDVHIALSGPDVTVRFINMPEMKEADLKNSLKYEADKYIPYGIDEVVMDSCILGKVQEEKSQIRALLAAAKKDVVNTRIEIFKQLGYNIRLIDVDSFAMFNAFLSSQKDLDKEKSIALLNLGHRFTNVVVLQGNSPYFTRDIQIAGEEITKTLSKQLNMDDAQVEGLKCEPLDKGGEAQNIIKGILNNLIDEIRLSFGYYENQYGKSIDMVYLSGGLVALSGFVGYFGDNLGVTPQVWDALSNFTLDEKVDREKIDKVKSSLVVSCGLAVRNIKLG